MFSMNTILKTHHLDDLKDELNYFYDINYNDLNLDALWKWATIWKVVKQLELLERPFRCVDIGGSLSPLHFIFSNYGEVFNVEIAGFNSTWFPVNSEGFYVNSSEIKHNRQNMQYVQEGFLTYMRKVPDNSIDFFYDGCSLIHFNYEKRYSHNDGVTCAIKEIVRALVPGGYFISASHVAHPDAHEVRDMIYSHHLGECFTSAGLRCVSEVDWNLEPFFRDKKNIHFANKSVPGYQKNTPIARTKCKGLPKYHCLYEGGLRGTTVVSCLYTLFKPQDLVVRKPKNFFWRYIQRFVRTM